MTAMTSSEFNRLMDSFAPFDSFPTLVIATSGGSDSLALAILAHNWAKQQGGKGISITIDHQLRENSTREAYQVKEWLMERGIEHHILTWVRTDKNKIPKAAIQSRAREARYQLLGQWCKDHNIKYLLTAHHAQDQLETFMIRLSKGSGLKGLTGIQSTVITSFGKILRPFLTVDSQVLKDTLQQLGQPYIQDPSNENKDFTRVRWRALLPTLAVEGLTAKTLQGTLERLSHAQRLIEQHISTLLDHHMMLSPYGYAILKKKALEESPEAFEEILKFILATIGTRVYPVRRQALHRAMGALKLGNSITLGGCQILDKAKEWWIVRESVSVAGSKYIKEPGTYAWDDRFIVEVPRAPCQIATLGEKGIQMLRSDFKERVKKIPYIVLQTLPALWQGDKVLEPFPSFTFIRPSIINVLREKEQNNAFL